LKSTLNIYDTIKEANPINGFFGYTFVIEEINHFVYGETKEEAFNFVADYINEYYGKNQQPKQNSIWQKKKRKLQKIKRTKR
jgi:hypothetical protein